MLQAIAHAQEEPAAEASAASEPGTPPDLSANAALDADLPVVQAAPSQAREEKAALGFRVEGSGFWV